MILASLPRSAAPALLTLFCATLGAFACGGDDAATGATTTTSTITTDTSATGSTTTETSAGTTASTGETSTSTGDAAPLVEPVAPLWKVVLGQGGGQAIVADPSGHAIAVGSSAAPEGDEDIMVLKIAADGTIVWQRQLGGGGQDLGSTVAVADDGDVFVGGKIGSAEVDFGGGVVVSGLEQGREYGFVARLDAATGEGEWVRLFRAADDGPAKIEHIDARGGRVVIGGRYDDALTYDLDDGSDVGTTAELAAIGTFRSSFFAALDASTGLARWMIGAGAAGSDAIHPDGVAIDGVGDLYGALTFSDDALIGLGEPRPRVGQGSDFVVFRLSADTGAPLWVQQFADAGGQAVANAGRLSQRGDGPLHVAATLRGTIDFGLGPLSAPEDQRDAIFLALDRATGLAVAQHQHGGPATRELGISARPVGDELLITGSYEIESKSGDVVEIEGMTLPDIAGGGGSWVVRYDPGGAAQWVRAVAPAARQEMLHPSVDVRDLVALPAGPVVLTGWVFGAGDLGDGDVITSLGSSRMVVWAWPP